MGNIRPFIKWVGGKTQLISDIDAHLPYGFESNENVCYYEPFIGGGAVMFHMLETYDNITRVIANDINPRLINCYKTVRNNVNELIEILEKLQEEYYNTPSEYRAMKFLDIREKYNRSNELDVTAAARFIYLNKTCYNGLYRENKKGEFNVPFGYYDRPIICDKELLLADSEALQKVEFTCMDFFNLIDFNQIDSNDGVYRFVYMDPPYVPISESAKFTQYTKESFDSNKQKEVDTIAQICKLYNIDVMISNSYAAGRGDDDVYKNYERFTVYANRNINSKSDSRGKIPEIILTTYSNIKMRRTAEII